MSHWKCVYCGGVEFKELVCKSCGAVFDLAEWWKRYAKRWLKETEHE